MNVLVSFIVYASALITSMAVLLLTMAGVLGISSFMKDTRVGLFTLTLLYILMGLCVILILGLLGMLVSWMLNFATLGRLGI